MRHPVILDCDPGIDDAIAIFLALASPEIDLLGLTCVVGNDALEVTTRNASRICALAGRADLPVHAGCSRPLMGAFTHSWPSVHGEDGLGNIAVPSSIGAPAPGHAVDFIIDSIMVRPGEITLCAVGPMTNIALAIVKEPRVAERLQRIVFMGGAAFEPGNSTPSAEFNFFVDPEAAQIVASSGVPLVMFGLDVTRRARITDDRLKAMTASGTPAAKAVADMLRVYGSADPCLHDPCAVAYLVAPEIFTGMEGRLSVLCSPAEARGKSLVAVSERHRGGAPANCLVMTECDSDALFDLLAERLAIF